MRVPSGFPIVDLQNPDSWGRCDRTGLPRMQAELTPQMEYFGNTLQWTGYMVGMKDLDEPNPQWMPVRLKPDPMPIPNPRIFVLPRDPAIPTGLNRVAAGTNTLSIAWTPVQEATNYGVFWENPQGMVTSTVSSTSPGAITAPNYVITGLSPSTFYTITIVSINNISYATLSDGIATNLSWNQSAQGGVLVPPPRPGFSPSYTGLYVQTAP